MPSTWSIVARLSQWYSKRTGRYASLGSGPFGRRVAPGSALCSGELGLSRIAETASAISLAFWNRSSGFLSRLRSIRSSTRVSHSGEKFDGRPKRPIGSSPVSIS